MKLYIKQKVFSWGDKFTVKDVNGEDRYFVEGEIFSWGKKLHGDDGLPGCRQQPHGRYDRGSGCRC